VGATEKQDVQQVGEALLAQLEKVIFGKTSVLRLAITCLLADGHLLIEDVPGTAKTIMAKALSRAVGGIFNRVQGTPDLLPGDITGSHIYHPGDREFTFHPGSIFANVVLADEINRATPRAQAALLECMAERQLSIDGKRLELPQPFLVIATQNPIDHEGTFPLPEAQLDRFLMKLTVGYPHPDAEAEMLVAGATEHPLDQVEAVTSPEALADIQRQIVQVQVEESVRKYVVKMVGSTRSASDLVLGGGPRATKGLYRASQAWAALDGRDFVTPDDVKRLTMPILSHRVILGPEARFAGKRIEQVLEEAMRLVPAPVVHGG